MSSRIVAFVFARGGSKGLPRKNLALLNGKPLLVHALEVAQNCRLIDRVIVSTDDGEIATVAREHGADVPFMRPPELATDTAREIDAWKHALKYLQDNGERADVFVSVPATAPLRRTEDLDACIRELLDTEADMVISVCEAARNPYFNMVVEDEKGYCRLVMEGDSYVTHRQSAPAVYDMATVAWVAQAEYIMAMDTPWDGKVRAVKIPRLRALDIDSELDLKIAELVLRENLV